jgi:RNA polymerase sigma-70 factor, ECF subfamily
MTSPRRFPTPIDPTDATLVADVRAGNARALGALYERYGSPLLAVAHRLLQSTADAEDVVHDVFVGLPEALRRYEERGALGAWLRTITARVALAKMRADNAREQVALTGIAEPASRQRDIEGVMSLEAAMQQLTPGLRAVLVLKEIEGFSHAEIAEMLDISVGASEVRLHRAVAALRALLTGGQGR